MWENLCDWLNISEFALSCSQGTGSLEETKEGKSRPHVQQLLSLRPPERRHKTHFVQHRFLQFVYWKTLPISHSHPCTTHNGMSLGYTASQLLTLWHSKSLWERRGHSAPRGVGVRQGAPPHCCRRDILIANLTEEGQQIRCVISQKGEKGGITANDPPGKEPCFVTCCRWYSEPTSTESHNKWLSRTEGTATQASQKKRPGFTSINLRQVKGENWVVSEKKT